MLAVQASPVPAPRSGTGPADKLPCMGHQHLTRLSRTACSFRPAWGLTGMATARGPASGQCQLELPAQDSLRQATASVPCSPGRAHRSLALTSRVTEPLVWCSCPAVAPTRRSRLAGSQEQPHTSCACLGAGVSVG